MVHSLQTRQYSHKGNPWQVHDHGWTQQQQLQEIAENDRDQQHSQMELTEIQQQIQQPNLQTQLMEQKQQTQQSSQMWKTQHVQEYLLTQQLHPPEMVHNDLVKWKELYKHNQQPSQIERMEPQLLGASMEGGSSTIDSRLQERMMEPRSIEQLWQMVHSLKARRYSHKGSPWQVHDHGWTQQQQLQEIAENDHEQRSLQLLNITRSIHRWS